MAGFELLMILLTLIIVNGYSIFINRPDEQSVYIDDYESAIQPTAYKPPANIFNFPNLFHPQITTEPESEWITPLPPSVTKPSLFPFPKPPFFPFPKPPFFPFPKPPSRPHPVPSNDFKRAPDVQSYDNNRQSNIASHQILEIPIWIETFGGGPVGEEDYYDRRELESNQLIDSAAGVERKEPIYQFTDENGAPCTLQKTYNGPKMYFVVTCDDNTFDEGAATVKYDPITDKDVRSSTSGVAYYTDELATRRDSNNDE